MRRLAAGCLALGLIAAAHAATTERTVVERIRYIGTASYGRIVVDLSGPARFHLQTVMPEGKAGPADRLVIDVENAKIGAEAHDPLTVGDALLRGIRTGQYTLETARIVLDLAGDADARTFLLPDPYRLVIDLRGKGVGSGASPLETAIHRLDSAQPASAVPAEPASARVEPSAPTAVARQEPREVPAVVPPSGQRFRVVLDPGHGGKDPGARGFDGLEEKDLVLAVANLLAERLHADPGVEVAMTRTDDRYLTLEERTGFANAQGADLFISIHGNASPNRALRGVEVYYLNNTNNRGTLRLAAMENNLRWDPSNPRLQQAIPDLSYILSDLRQTYKVEESKQLADSLQHSVVARLQEKYTGVDDLGVKEGPFYVLVGAYMPCVLVEVSFLTNSIEGRRLGTHSYRNALADGIYEGIRRYRLQTKLAKTL